MSYNIHDIKKESETSDLEIRELEIRELEIRELENAESEFVICRIPYIVCETSL